MGPEELRTAIDELTPHVSSLATHSFGNYLVSTMASMPVAHPALYAAMRGRVTALMQHPQGSRVIQACFGNLAVAQTESLVGELVGRVVEVSLGTHGSWSVVAAYKATHAPFIVTELAAQVTKLAMQQNGSRVVQRVMSEAATAGCDVSELVHALLGLEAQTLVALAADRFANYVVQLALRGADAAARAQLIDAMMPFVFSSTLSESKCGSNVAEMVIDLASANQIETARVSINEQAATMLRNHPYGKYVMVAFDRRV